MLVGALVLALIVAAGSRSAPAPVVYRVVGEHRDAWKWSNPVNRNLAAIASCETGGKPGQNGRPDWEHRSSSYAGALGFAHSTWSAYRKLVRPVPPARADHARPGAQYAVGRVLVYTFGGYSSWPACSVRLGLRRG